MTNKEILVKIIQKAIDNGYTSNEYDEHGEDWVKDSGYIEDGRLYNLIFSHSFAEKFWGEESESIKACNNCSGDGWVGSPETGVRNCGICKGKGSFKTGLKNKEGWQYYLQQMVLEKEPLKYLEKFV